MRIKSVFLIVCMIMSQLVFNAEAVSNETGKMLAYFDFEEITDTAEVYIANNELTNTFSTNNGLKKYDFIYENGSRRMLFTGYNNSEISGNASRVFDFKFNTAFSKENFPDSYLVIGYTENHKLNENSSLYTQTILKNDSENLFQMFLLQNAGGYIYRPNNKGFGQAMTLNEDMTHKYIFDFTKKSYTSEINGISGGAVSFNADYADTIRFSPNKGQIYSVDNIYAYAVPKNFGILNCEAADSKTLNVYLTAPVTEDTLQYISVEKDGIIQENTYSLSCDTVFDENNNLINKVNVNFSAGLTEGSTYKILFSSEFYNIAGQSLGAEKTTEITVADVPPCNESENFKILSHNATNGFSPLETLCFNLSKQISSISDKSIEIKTDGLLYKNYTVTYTNYNDGTCNLYIHPKEGIFPYGTHFDIKFLSEIKNTAGDGLTSETVSFDTCMINDDFSVYQKSVNVAQAGLGGFGMLADFSADKPQKVYFSRTTYNPEVESDTPFVPSAYAKVISPDGKTVFFYDFTYMENGTKSIVADIDFTSGGIWQFQFVSGRTGDELCIGINEAENWGVRGECVLGVSETTPLTSYVYASEKNISVLISSLNGRAMSLYDKENTLVSQTNQTGINTKSVMECDIEGESVYRLVLEDGFFGGIVVDRIPSLMCPTAQMAQNLKGGLIETEGVLCQGNVQSNARKEALRLLAEKDLTVECDKPQNLPTDIEYPVAEALLFGTYGLVSPLGDQAVRQITDPKSPYLGRFLTKDEYASGGISQSWETGFFNPWGSTAFGGVVSTPAQLNYFYENDALITRSAIAVLGTLAALSEDFIIREGNDASVYPTTHGNFYFSWMAKCYADIRQFLEPKTVEVIDTVIIDLCDKQGNYRGMNVNNQWMFTVSAIDAVYRAVGSEHINDALYRHITALYSGAYKGRQGQSAAGYFIEGYGCDGSYHNLNQQLIYTMYKAHKSSEYRDERIVNMLYDIIDKNVWFDSLFWTTQPQYVGIAGPNCFTARTTGKFGCIDHINYPVIVDEFPLAKRRFEIMNMPKSSVGGAGTFPYYVNNSEWAMRLINSCWSAYENKTKNYSSNGFKEWYYALKNADNLQSELLPCEYEEGIWEKNGIIAVSHKGLYFNVFYTFPENDSMPDNSFMGGGVTVLHSVPTGVAVASEKHKNYTNITSSDDIMATCVYGNNEDGKIIYSGKGKASLEWKVPEKIFEIKENITGTDAEAVWRYELRENDVKMSVNVSGDDTLKDLYLNVPIKKIEESAFITSDSNAVYYNYENDCIAISSDTQGEVSLSGNTSRFRIKLDDSNSASVVFTLQSSQKTAEITEYTENNGKMNIAVRNNISEKQDMLLICSVYDKNGKLSDISCKDIAVDGHGYKNSEFKLNKDNDSTVKIFLWESIKTMKPLDCR